jgi:hypothetical protein
MFLPRWSLWLIVLAALAGEARGQVFGTVRGTVEDSQRLPIFGVKVTLKGGWIRVRPTRGNGPDRSLHRDRRTGGKLHGPSGERRISDHQSAA